MPVRNEYTTAGTKYGEYWFDKGFIPLRNEKIAVGTDFRADTSPPITILFLLKTFLCNFIYRNNFYQIHGTMTLKKY